MGLNLLKKSRSVVEEDEVGEEGGATGSLEDRISENEIVRNQEKLARGIVIFMELLHILIARNRDLLLAVVQARKRSRGSVKNFRNTRVNHSNPSSPDSIDRLNRMSSSHSVGRSVASSEGLSTDGSNIQPGKTFSDDRRFHSSASISGFSTSSWSHVDRADSSFVVQSELQRSFLSMSKVLYPIISNVIHEETPRWLRLCSRTDGYFSSGSYRHTRICESTVDFLFYCFFF